MKSTCCNSALCQAGFAVGAEIPGAGCGLPLSAPKGGSPLVLIWTVGTSLLQALLPGLFLQQEDGTAGERMNKILFQMQCVYTVVFWGFFVLGTAVPVVVIGICWGNEQNWKCQLLLLCSNPDCDGNIDTNSSSKSVSYAEEVLLWMPSGVYCNPCYPCASLLQHCPCRKIGRMLLIPHSHPELGTCCVLNICFPPALCCHGSRTWPNKCTFFGAVSVNFLSVHF